MRRGALYAAGAYVLWGVFPLYFKALRPVPATEIVAHRMVWSLAFVAALLAIQRRWAWLRELRNGTRTWLVFAGSALLITANWTIYIWAANSGHVIDASLGYFINPLVSVLLGAAALGERLRPPQWAAVALAAAGVVVFGIEAGSPPWIGLGLAVSFALYGLMRKIAHLGALEGLALETALMFPFAVAYLGWLAFDGRNSFVDAPWTLRGLLCAAGPVTAVPLLLFAAGARRITLTLLGVLQYVSPTLQWLLGILVFHEAFDRGRAIGFALIWIALAAYSAEGSWQVLKARRRPAGAGG
ncbi:MAG TPA: EamA family transporter RarD [Burkholderiaceae bacterium]|nr:EamA family transporter RarD [Burkholderiaceae bacterium]